jgi:hypothetical protein
MISVEINICLFRHLRELTSRHARLFDLSMLSLVLILIEAGAASHVGNGGEVHAWVWCLVPLRDLLVF